jgi:hypothetical protein
MVNGSENPSELMIDASTGTFTFINDASIKTFYNVDIVISTCGPDSTTLVAPSLSVLRKASVENRSLMIESAMFLSSN